MLIPEKVPEEVPEEVQTAIDNIIDNINTILPYVNEDMKKKSEDLKLYLKTLQNGGKNTKLSQYKKMLEKKDVKKLYKMAKEMGIKITKKKDGKTSYIKKETIVKKICDAKYKKTKYSQI